MNRKQLELYKLLFEATTSLLAIDTSLDVKAARTKIIKVADSVSDFESIAAEADAFAAEDGRESAFAKFIRQIGKPDGVEEDDYTAVQRVHFDELRLKS